LKKPKLGFYLFKTNKNPLFKEATIVFIGIISLRPLQNYLKYKILTFLTSSFVVVEKFQSSLTIG